MIPDTAILLVHAAVNVEDGYVREHQRRKELRLLGDAIENSLRELHSPILVFRNELLKDLEKR